MKKYCLLLLLIFAVNFNVFSYENERKFTIQANPVLLLSNIRNIFGFTFSFQDKYIIMDLEGQYKINEIFNLSLTLSFLYESDFYYWGEDAAYWNDPAAHYKQKYILASIKPMLMYRPFGTGLEGFYIGLYPDIGLAKITSLHYENYSGADIGFGFNAGYKWIRNSGLTFQIGAGIGNTWFIPDDNESKYYFMRKSDGRLYYGDVIVLFDFKMGYSF